MTSTKLPYTLLDGIKMNAEHPDTFDIPDSRIIEAIRPGDFVKLCFEPAGPEALSERMWVTVATIIDGHYTGHLACWPVMIPVDYGALVEFTSANILDVDRPDARP